MARLLPLIAPLLILTLPGCDRRPDDAPMVVSVIGAAASLRDPAAGRMDMPARVLTDATAQGLVRFDAAGAIEPGLAERWIVTDGGRSYIFRLRDAEWDDGKQVTAAQVVESLRRTIAARSRTPLAPFLAVIDEIVEMTPQVIEVRLSRPRPDLLKLFAQPELAVVRRGGGTLSGSGPFRVAAGPAGWTRLRPGFDPTRGDEAEAEPAPSDMVMLRGERAGAAVLRFARHDSDLLLGGSFRDWPLLAAADVAPANIRIDPASGLFGLAIVSREGLLAQVENRQALAMAIDRPALTARFRPEWQPVETLFPQRLDSAVAPTPPDWQAMEQEDRVITARSRIAAWRRLNPQGNLTIRIALPADAGGNLIWGRVARDLIAIGLRPVRVAEQAEADLRLIDEVAPYDSGRWYLVTACRSCPEALMARIEAARDAPTLAERARAIAAADLALTDDGAYIPIAQPLRWSLVALRLRAWQENNRAWHALTHLRRQQ
jgi:peptide/nickel transport system substrate-binding protein